MQPLSRAYQVPSQMEIAAVLSSQPVMVRVYLLDGSYKNMPADSHTTAAVTAKLMSRALGVKDTRTAFAVYELNERDEEHVINDDDRILDLVAYWQVT